jgi:hypothetical protein
MHQKTAGCSPLLLGGRGRALRGGAGQHGDHWSEMMVFGLCGGTGNKAAVVKSNPSAGGGHIEKEGAEARP